MHELSVTESVLRIALEHGQRAGARRITAVQLVIGDMAGFVNDSIQFYFDLLSRGTPAEGAQLRFERVATRLRCRQCGCEFAPEGTDWRCPQCQAWAGEVLAGKEFYIDSIEIE
jgi:hydrogenase nickel incorporation protein HypA/HybF